LIRATARGLISYFFEKEKFIRQIAGKRSFNLMLPAFEPLVVSVI